MKIASKNGGTALLATIGIIANVIGGVSGLTTLGKTMDDWCKGKGVYHYIYSGIIIDFK